MAGVTLIEVKPVSEPVPNKLTCCGLVGTLSETARAPVRVPSAVGMKVMEIVQLPPPANAFGAIGQFELWAKSPVETMLVIVRGMLWLLVKVTILEGLVVLTTWDANVKEALESWTTVTPFPSMTAVCGLLLASFEITRLPLRGPSTVGVNVRAIVQFAPPARVLGTEGQFEV